MCSLALCTVDILPDDFILRTTISLHSIKYSDNCMLIDMFFNLLFTFYDSVDCSVLWRLVLIVTVHSG